MCSLVHTNPTTSHASLLSLPHCTQLLIKCLPLALGISGEAEPRPPPSAMQGPHLAQPSSTFQSSGYPTDSGGHVTRSRQSGSQDSCLECRVRNVLFGIRLLVATKAVGTGLNEENQPEDKANTVEGRAKRITKKGSWSSYFRFLLS